MEQALEHRIRERAYELWNAGGRVEGQADHHWLVAERQVLIETSREIAVAEIAPAKPRLRKRQRANGGLEHRKTAKADLPVSQPSFQIDGHHNR